MRKIFLISALSVLALAGNFHFENELDITYSDMSSSQEQSKENQKTLRSFFSYETKDSRFTAETIAQYGSDKNDQWNNKNGGKEGGMSIESLMYERKLTDEISISGGVIPFTNDNDFFFDDGFIEENGNPILISLPLQSVFLSYKKSIGDFDTVSKLGYGIYDYFKLPHRDTQYYENSKSDGIFFIQSWDDGINKIQIDAYMAKIKYLEKDEATLKLASILYKTVDPWIDAKWFISAGYSEFDQKTSDIKNTILDGEGTPRSLPDIIPDDFSFENTKKSGKFFSIGASKRFDKLTTRICAIWMSKNWVSLASTTDTDSPFFYENRGRSIAGKISYDITKNLSVSFEDVYIKKDWTSRIGSSINPVPSGNNSDLPNDYKYKHISTFQLSYTF
jgi:hypothetical protein